MSAAASRQRRPAVGRRIKISTSPVADRYAMRDEKIIEFSSEGGGGLISFHLTGTEGQQRLVVDVYRTDDTVEIRHAGARGQADTTREEPSDV